MLDADLRRAKHFAIARSRLLPAYGRAIDFYWRYGTALDQLITRIAADDELVPRLCTMLGVDKLPKGEPQDGDTCVIAVATGKPFEIDWARDPIEFCAFAAAFDAGHFPEYVDDDVEWWVG